MADPIAPTILRDPSKPFLAGIAHFMRLEGAYSPPVRSCVYKLLALVQDVFDGLPGHAGPGARVELAWPVTILLGRHDEPQRLMIVAAIGEARGRLRVEDSAGRDQDTLSVTWSDGDHAWLHVMAFLSKVRGLYEGD